jgi:transposase-like protein
MCRFCFKGHTIIARPTKLNSELQKQVIDRLAAGSTIKATCDSVGIAERTYYQWVACGEAFLAGEDHAKMPRLIADREALAQFSQEVTRAQADGMIQAAIRFRAGMNPSESETVTTETVTETKIRTIKHPDGTIEQVPYEVVKTTTRQSITHNPGDWRAAMEYLARRDPENWARSAAQKHEVTGADGGAIHTETTHKFETMSDDELRSLITKRTSGD